MASTLRTFFETIKTRIEAEVPELLTVKLHNNQVDNESEEEAFAYPAVFLEFSEIIWNQGQRGINYAQLLITFHIAVETYETDDLNFFDLVNKFFVALHGYGTPDFTELKRIEDRQDTDHDNCLVWEMDFRCQLLDCTADPRLKQVTSAGPHALELNTDLDIDNVVIRTGDGEI